MDNQKLQNYFLLVFLTGVLVLAFFVFNPFLHVIILASVFSVIFGPLYRKILRFAGNREGLAAFATTLIVIAFILVPLVFLGIQIFEEARNLYSSLSGDGVRNAVLALLNGFVEKFQAFFPGTEEISLDVDQYLRGALDWLLQNLGAIFSNFAKVVASSFIFFIALYYLLRDGQKFKKSLIALSPLRDTDDEAIFKKLELAVSSVMKGNLLIGLIQGLLTGIGFFIFGVPNPVLWGTVAAIAALIPGFGTSLVLIPAIVFLFLSGKAFVALGLLTWGLLAVGLIDNFLGPKLIGRGMHLHPLFVFLSVLGGIVFFGPLGVLLGPLILSLLFALLDIYSFIIGHKK